MKQVQLKQVQFAAFGAPQQVAACVEVADIGPPTAEEVVVEVEAFPINPADLLTITGGYAVRPELPATLGAEGVGVVSAVGSAVDDLSIGDRVMILARDNWAQKRKLPARAVLKMPTDTDVLQLAMLKVNPATALMMLRNHVHLQPGEWVIQDAANSAVGVNLIKLAKADGVHTVNVVRRAELVEPLKAIGADVVVVDSDDLAERVRAEVSGAAIKLAIDAVGSTMITRLGDCLAEGGTIVNYGLLSGQPCQIRADQTIFKGVTLTGFWLTKALSNMARGDLETLYTDLARRIASGELRVEVEATYPIEEIKVALAHAARESRGGKILVTPNGSI